MSAPRKYPTLTEFEELKKAVDKLSRQLQRGEEQTCYVPAAETSAGLGIVDENGVPVTIGCWIQWLGYDGCLTSPAERVYKMEIEEATAASGRATIVVCAGKRNNSGEGCVNGVLRNHAVVEVSAPKKATA